MVENALRAAHPDLQVERVVIATTGDKRPDLRFSEFTTGDRLDKGIFTKELEIALESGAIDIAVHSLKDVPTVLDPQFGIAAVLPRAPIEDVLITREGWTIQTLPSGAKIGTSSVRRIRQLLWMRPDVSCVEIRGNVPTRVRKLIAPSELDGILLAKAGLSVSACSWKSDRHRHRWQTLPAAILPSEKISPRRGQGAVALKAAETDTVTLDLPQRHQPSAHLHPYQRGDASFCTFSSRLPDTRRCPHRNHQRAPSLSPHAVFESLNEAQPRPSHRTRGGRSDQGTEGTRLQPL